MGESRSGSGGFWASLPGLLTGLAALLTAVGGIYALTRGSNAPAPAATGVTAAQSAVPAANPSQAVRSDRPELAAAIPATASGSAAECLSGFVWREARPADRVCVAPETRDETRAENEAAGSRRSADGGAYGPNTCLPGFVWRNAFQDDVVCVTPESRDRAWKDNQAAVDRIVRS